MTKERTELLKPLKVIFCVGVHHSFLLAVTLTIMMIVIVRSVTLSGERMNFFSAPVS